MGLLWLMVVDAIICSFCSRCMCQHLHKWCQLATNWHRLSPAMQAGYIRLGTCHLGRQVVTAAEWSCVRRHNVTCKEDCSFNTTISSHIISNATPLPPESILGQQPLGAIAHYGHRALSPSPPAVNTSFWAVTNNPTSSRLLATWVVLSLALQSIAPCCSLRANIHRTRQARDTARWPRATTLPTTAWTLISIIWYRRTSTPPTQ